MTFKIGRTFLSKFVTFCVLFLGTSVVYVTLNIHLLDMSVKRFSTRRRNAREQQIEKITYKERVVVIPPKNNLYSEGGYWREAPAFTYEHPSGKEQFVIFDGQNGEESVHFLNDIPKGWSVFVVNHAQTADLESCPNCLTFSRVSKASKILEDLKTMHRDTLTPRALEKMAATIFAVQEKAPWIYVTDKRMPVPFATLRKVSTEHPSSGVVYSGPRDLFQPCGHLMDTFTWHGKGHLSDQSQYSLRSVPAVSLYQVVDQCYRSGMDAHSWKTLLDGHAPVAYTMAGVWSAVDVANVLVPLEAAWTLVTAMPTSASSNGLDQASQMLSLFVQRLLWETQVVIGFVPGTPNGQTCPTCEAEKRIVDLGKSRLDSLVNWTCGPQEVSIGLCLNKIVSALGTGTGNEKEMQSINSLLNAWTKALEDNGFSYGQRLPLNSDILKARGQGNALYFTPAKSLQKPNATGHTLPPNSFGNICGSKFKPYTHVIPDTHPDLFQSTVLVISFNSNRFLDVIQYLEPMFGRHFKHILYCTSGLAAFERDYMSNHNANPVTFIDVAIKDGILGHMCSVAAMNMNYFNVTGYLYMSDDVPISTWNMHHHPFYMPWFQADIRVVNLNSSYTRGHRYAVNWYPWNQTTGRPAIARAIERLKSLKSDPVIGQRVSWFLKNLEKMTECDNCIAYMDADLHYIPHYMASDFRFFVPYFSEVFQELSVITILAGITPDSDRNIYRLRGYYLIGNVERTHFDKAWSREELFIHPVKLSYLQSNPKVRRLFCQYMSYTDQDLMVNSFALSGK